MAATAAAVKLGGSTKLRCDDDQGGVEQSMPLQVRDQGCERLVKIPNQQMLAKLPVIVRIPSRTVEEVEVEGDFDEANAGLNEASRQEAALAELASVAFPEWGWLLGQVEDIEKAGARHLESALTDLLLFPGTEVVLIATNKVVVPGVQECLPTLLALRGDVVREGEAGRAGFDLGEVNVAVFRPKKARIPGDVRVAHHDVGGNAFVLWPQLVGDNRPEGGVDHRLAGFPACMNQVGCRTVLRFDIM